jgi:hypothetical protein
MKLTRHMSLRMSHRPSVPSLPGFLTITFGTNAQNLQEVSYSILFLVFYFRTYTLVTYPTALFFLIINYRRRVPCGSQGTL